MADYQKHVSTRETDQKTKALGTTQIPNSEGGFVWPVDDWLRLYRFLIRGSEGGTYYTGERELTRSNADTINKLLSSSVDDGLKVVETVITISVSGRAPKNDPALFVLAMAASCNYSEVRYKALAALPIVARTGTHLFTFVKYVEAFRGWGRSLCKAVGEWYTKKDLNALTYQVVKYRQRGGWSHRDLLRLSHPNCELGSIELNAIAEWITQGRLRAAAPDLLHDYVSLQRANTASEIVALLEKNKLLTWEMVPTDFLTDYNVWYALLPNIPLTALIRHLSRLTAIGVLRPGHNIVTDICDKITNEERLIQSRVHPLQILAAIATYSSGGALGRTSLSWKPVPQITDALDTAFYYSFGSVKPTEKRLLLAVDVSASMGWHELNAIPGVTPRVAAAAMAMLTARTERRYSFVAFSHDLVPFTLSAATQLNDAIYRISDIPMGGTDCALPMLYAIKNNLDVDAFVIYTDNETHSGYMHPFEALRKYREHSGIAAKLIVVAMESNGFSIADPRDAGMLDVVGFDTAAPDAIAQFISE